MDKKQLNVKDILINNGIVILILLMVLFVGVTKPFCRTSGWTFCLPGRYSAPEE